MTDLDQLDIMRRAITALGLGQCAPEDLVAEARASASRREQDLTAKDALIAELRADLDTAQRQTVATKTWGEGYQNALRLYFDKMGLNGAGSLDDRMAHVAKICGAWAALTRICEVIGAPVPVCPDDAVDVVKRQLGDDNDANNRAQKAEATIAEMIKALSDHGAPRRYEVYGAPDKLGPILSPVERLRVTLSIYHWKADAAERRAHEAEEAREALLQERRFARDALLDAGAPCRADGFDLDLAARIRSLPR